MSTKKLLQRIAVLYQASPPPVRDGIAKPMKPGGYSDSGADIACELQKCHISVVTPNNDPSINNDFDWVFPDTREGINSAIQKGAETFWLNTVLYKGHPVESYAGRDISFIGQLPENTDQFDDKVKTNNLLRENGLAVLEARVVQCENMNVGNFKYPAILKPIRGRGSQGVVMVENKEDLDLKLRDLISCGKYGNALYVEDFLQGEEITVTVMPPGKYKLSGQWETFEKPWSLPAVKRFNHCNGIAPYSGVVAVMNNSCVLNDNELSSEEIRSVHKECEKAALLVNARAPIRVDARADSNGKYWIFDLNMKPNMTGPSRPHRQGQDSLTLMAAGKIGWSYGDFLTNISLQSWTFSQ